MDTDITTIIDQYLDYCDKELGLSKKTIYDNYAREFGKFRRMYSDKKMEEFTIDDLTNYFRSEEDRGLCVNSVNTARGYIRGMFYYCQYYRHITLQFDYKMIRKKKDNTPKRIKYAKVDDVREILGVLEDHQDQLIVITLFSAGLRISELVRLKAEDLDEDSRGNFELSIFGKGSKPRQVPIKRELAIALKDHMLDCNIVTGTIFRHRVEKKTLTNKGYTVSGLRNRFIRNLSPYGLYPSFHWYRHGIATSLYNDGADLRWLQEFLGHADIRTTQIYTHVSSERRRDVYEEHFPKQFDISKLLDNAAMV